MKQADLILGFSEIKDILVRAHQIDRPRNQIRLFFSQTADELYVHDYADHKRSVILVDSIAKKSVLPIKEKKAFLIIRKALSHHAPANYLNEGF